MTNRAILGNGSGGGFCGPVFESFMKVAIKKYGGTKFKVPPGGYFVKIDRFTGAKLPDDARATTWWRNISARAKSRSSAWARWSMAALPWGQNLPLFAYGETDTDTGARP
jgi:penicillin-binding protein 1A